MLYPSLRSPTQSECLSSLIVATLAETRILGLSVRIENSNPIERCGW